MLLVVENLGKEYRVAKNLLSNKTLAVDALCDINFKLGKGSVLGILGESGSGKTTLAKLIVKLIEPTKGKITYSGISDFHRLIQMVFQNPYNSLNPMMKIKDILAEPFLIHKLAKHRDIESKLNTVLEKVSLNRDCLNRYPDEFSGGQKQRIAIARAISVEPKILVCDEPTSSLDLSIQAQILNLFIKLKQDFGLSYIFISHNIEVISFIANEILILYEGMQVERGRKERIFNNPVHPYTKILLGFDDSQLEKYVSDGKRNGCKFYANCKFRSQLCQVSMPGETEVEEGHYARCHIFK
ncbi:MAG: ATP-binding cassette domain-containing protein [Candidatus Omnitrophica bacterium]|nr:ATP-binding cassette domain-containing protein [Candidatus Omnitrophota bacterium]